MKHKCKWISTGVAGLILTSSISLAVNDISDHWAKQYIEDLIQKNIIEGYENNEFKPESFMTREEAAEVISNYIGGSGDAEIPKDSEGRWSSEAIRNLISKDIVEGYEDESFKPKNLISRAEYASMLYKTLSTKETGSYDYSPEVFNDILGHWAYPYITELHKKGIVSGYGDDTFKPDNNIKRAEAVAMLYEVDNFLAEEDNSNIVTLKEYFRFDRSTGTILGYVDTDEAPKDVIIPREIDGIPVTGIESYAFRGDDGIKNQYRKNKIKSVIIPDSVEWIGYTAFASNELEEVYIPDSVIKIEDAAFYGNKLNSIRIPSNLHSIGNEVFSDNDLESVTIPHNVRFIGERAFKNNKLTEVNIPKSVVEIKKLAFIENNLSSVRIPVETELEMSYIGDSKYSPFDSSVKIIRY